MVEIGKFCDGLKQLSLGKVINDAAFFFFFFGSSNWSFFHDSNSRPTKY